MPTAGIVIGGAQRRFHPLEVGEAVLPIPLLQPIALAPLLVIHRVAALENLPINRRRTTDDLAAGVVNPTAMHFRLGDGLVLPVVMLIADGERECRRHVDVEIPEGVIPPCLQHHDRRRKV